MSLFSRLRGTPTTKPAWPSAERLASLTTIASIDADCPPPTKPVPAGRKTVLWAIPMFQAVYGRPFGAFLAQALNVGHTLGDRFEIVPHVYERGAIHTVMNQAADVAVRSGVDYVVMSDDDCLPPFWAISALLDRCERLNLPFLAGAGIMRGYPHTTTVARWFKEGVSLSPNHLNGKMELTGFKWLDRLEQEPGDLVACDFCGFPVAVIAVEALKRIGSPWFGTYIKGGGCTHDVFFGVRAAEAKIQLLVDRSIKCDHLGEAPVIGFGNRDLLRESFEGWRAAQEAENERGRLIREAAQSPPTSSPFTEDIFK